MFVKRAILYGIFLWIISILIGFGLLSLVTPSESMIIGFTIGSFIIVTTLVSWSYFKVPKKKWSAREGLTVGVIFFLVWFVLDLAIMLVYGWYFQDYSYVSDFCQSWEPFISALILIMIPLMISIHCVRRAR